jgi:DNA topoisomerase-1
LIVQRERERMAFRSATYWDLLGHFATQAREAFSAELVSVEGRNIPAGKDFDSSTGKLRNPQLLLLDEPAAQQLAERLRSASFRVTNVENRPYTNRPAPPFTTSTLQQEANRKLGYGARRTMDIAQSLYENGYITYMRTDSTNLAQVAVDAARDLVRSQYGAEYLTPEPRVYKSKVKNAQEAHEAIRPAGHPFKLPEALKGELTYDQFRLFDLIWKRTIASQMADARGNIVRVTLEGDGAVFAVSGKTIEFPGFLRAYVEGSDDPEAELSDKETVLPAMKQGDAISVRELEPKSHTTQPPARFSEASLTKTLEEMGIGRPSTYASIIETIVGRDYVVRKGNALVPTWTAFSVAKLLEQHLPNLVDYQFTAQMEDFLDAISRHEAESLSYLREFYFGDGEAGLKPKLAEKVKEIDPRDISRFSLGKPDHGLHREEVFVRVGKFAPFIEQGDRKTSSIPEDMAPDELTLEKALEMLDQASQGETPLGYAPDGAPIFLKNGRFGPYVQRGSLDGEEKPKNASVPKGVPLTEVSVELALKLLSLPRTLGKHPETGDDVIATNGPYGPYVKCGKESRSLPADQPPTDVTLDQALVLLAQPKQRGRGRAAAPEPIKVFDPSPATKQPIKLLSGRYGAYVTDGETNATLPRDMTPENLTFDDAVRLLAERAAKGPPVKKRRFAKRKKG